MRLLQATIFGFLCLSSVTAECLWTMEECEFYLVIEHKLTMMHHKQLVFPANGSLYKYDVTDVSAATPIPVEDVISADGWEEPRLVAVVNGTLPGPDIIVYEGQTIIVHIENTLTSDASTIHWHGLHQVGTPWMDGVPYVTQCPIQPGQTFTYRFKAKPRGTFWYHSHVGAQRSMGVFGAFVIREKKEVTVPEYIIQIQDWNHDWDSDLSHMKMLYGVYTGRHKWSGLGALDGSFFSLFKYQSGLINGKGRHYNPTDNRSPLEIYSVRGGTKYRFRVIGTGALYPFRVSVDNHMLTVIASDGYDLEPIVAESFIINPGERFDFEITADQPVGNYWIRGLTLVIADDHHANAILRYEGANEMDPTTSRKSCTSNSPCLVLNCPFTYYPKPNTMCRTFDELKAGTSDDPSPPFMDGKFKEYFLNFAFPGTTWTPGSVNGRQFDTPHVNPLTQPTEWYSPCDKPECGPEKVCKCTHALHIGNGDTVQLVMSNMGVGKGWSHPIHMHGHSFYVVKMGYGQYNETSGKILGDNLDINCRGNADRDRSFCNDATWSNQTWLNGNVPDLNLENPPRKDTIIVPTGGYVVLRIRANNPGIWNMHCHIELHNLDGMQMLLNESFTEVPTAPEGFPKCHSFPRSPNYFSSTVPSTTEEIQAQQTEAMYSHAEFWALFGVFLAVIVVQFLVIIKLCVDRRQKSGGSKYNVSKGNTNTAYAVN